MRLSQGTEDPRSPPLADTVLRTRRATARNVPSAHEPLTSSTSETTGRMNNPKAGSLKISIPLMISLWAGYTNKQTKKSDGNGVTAADVGDTRGSEGRDRTTTPGPQTGELG